MSVKKAPRGILEELFQDYYTNRWRIYWLNFWRGIFFGFGSAIGATILVALLLWVLSLLQMAPYIGDTAQKVHDTVESTQK